MFLVFRHGRFLFHGDIIAAEPDLFKRRTKTAAKKSGFVQGGKAADPVRPATGRNPAGKTSGIHRGMFAVEHGGESCFPGNYRTEVIDMTRNESKEFYWANTILRIAALGMPGDDYPVTHARHHKNLLIVSDCATARKPQFNL